MTFAAERREDPARLSTDAFALSPDERAHFEKEGFVVRQGVFSKEECDRLGERAERLALGEGALPEEFRRVNALVSAGQETERSGVEAMHSVCMPHLYDDLFRARMRDPRVTDVVASLLGPDLLTHNSLFIFKAPGIGLPFPWHQDLWYFRKRFETETTIGTWQAIDDARIDNGCLWVIPGSHRWEVLEHDELEGPQQEEFRRARVPEGEEGIPVEIPAGSVLFFHSRLLHRSTHNHSPLFRRTYVAHYLSARATFADEKRRKGRPILWVRGQTHPGCVQPDAEE